MPTKDPPSSPSRSRSITRTVNGSHQFNISGYSLAKGMGVGKYMSSETFTVGNYKWAIYFYPDGKNSEDNSQYVSLFIALASEGNDVRALFELTMLDQSGRGRHKVHSHFDRALESGPYTLKYRGSMWGYKRFFRRLTLESSDYLKDDTLQITCTVGVVVTEMEGPSKPISIPIPPSRMGTDFEALLKNDESCDLSFEVGDEIIQGHKIILAARSPVLKALLYGPLRDRREGCIPVTDIEAPVFRALMHFIYTDSLPTTGPSALTPIMAQHLLAAADRYALDRLRIICESKLCETVDAETVATTLALAEQHNAERLKSVCLTFAAQNLASVIQSEGFEHLRVSCPSLQAELLQAVAGVGNNTDILSGVHGVNGRPLPITAANTSVANGNGTGAVVGPPPVPSTNPPIGAAAAAAAAGECWDDGDGSDPSGRRVRLRMGM